MTEEGKFATLEGGAAADPSPGATAILSRSLCRFAFMPAPAGLTGAKAERAAELFAETSAPLAEADFVVLPGVLGFGVWWWDRARLNEALGDDWAYDRLRILPETALQEVGDGWRQVVNADGFEAQLWRQATLVASVWRRRPFTGDQWRAFVRATHDPLAVGDAPSDPPPAETLALHGDAAARIARVRPRAGWRSVERGAVLATCLCLAAAAGLMGRAAGFDRIAQREGVVAAGLTAHAKKLEAARGPAGDKAVLAAVAELGDKPDPLLAAGELFRTLSARGVNIAAAGLTFSIADETLRIEAPAAPDVAFEDIASELEASPWFSGVAPEVDVGAGRARLLARLCNPISAASTDAAACAPGTSAADVAPAKGATRAQSAPLP